MVSASSHAAAVGVAMTFDAAAERELGPKTLRSPDRRASDLPDQMS